MRDGPSGCDARSEARSLIVAAVGGSSFVVAVADVDVGLAQEDDEEQDAPLQQEELDGSAFPQHNPLDPEQQPACVGGSQAADLPSTSLSS